MKFLYILACTILLVACKAGSNYKAPTIDLPEEFDMTSSERIAEHKKHWWLEFNDPELAALIDEALLNNSDILTAMSNVSMAQSQLTLSKADYLPKISAQGSSEKTKNSKKITSNQAGARVKTSSIGALLSYEIDLWGKVARANEAARATLLGMKDTADTVKLSVASNVASGYFSLIALDEQIVIMRRIITIEEEVVRLNQSLTKNGVGDAMTLSAAVANLATTEGQLPPLEQQLKEREVALSILLGRSPRAIVKDVMKRGRMITTLPSPPSVPKILPSKLLTQRPDVRSAERELIAANANIGVARAAYFPSLSLTALFGMSSENINNLFNKHAYTYNLTKSAAMPIFDFGATSANVGIAKSAKDQAMIRYAQAVRTAFGDIVNALMSQRTSASSYSFAIKNNKSLAEVMRLTDQQYKHGIIGRLGILAAEQNLLQSKLAVNNAKLAQLMATLDLYRALGGDW